MITLGADTSGRTLSVAVLRGGLPVAEWLLAAGYRHGITFQPAVEYVLQQAGLRLQDVDLFAVTTGPGSFTGIRIGLAAVKAMAYAVGAKAVGVSSLYACARSAVFDARPVLPLFDARGGRVFASLFRGEERVLDDEPRPIGELIRQVGARVRPDEKVLITGDGIDVLRRAVEDGHLALPFQVEYAPPHLRMIRASVVAGIAAANVERGLAETDPFLLDARYGLLSSAERAKPVSR